MYFHNNLVHLTNDAMIS